MRNFRGALIGLIVTATLAGPAKAENVVRFTGISGRAVTIDPHSYISSHNGVATKQVYEALLDIDSNLAISVAARLGLEAVGPDHVGVQAAAQRDLS